MGDFAMGMPSFVSLSDDQRGFVPANILHSSAFPHPVTGFAVRETNLSWVVLTGPYAYKIKKSVLFGYVDQSTVEKRKALCEEELRLNRRLASDLYEAVLPITHGSDGLQIGGAGVVVDYAVKMKQFEAAQELSVLLADRLVDAAEIGNLGARLADFHQSLPRAVGPPDMQGTQHLHDAVLGSLAMVLCHLDEAARPSALGILVDWIHDFFHNSLSLLCKRERDGHIRECHGDLHARNIVRWHGQLIPFDSLEFDPKLRWIDTMNDTAFLFMDLASHNRHDLAFSFLNAYLSRTGDYDGVRLLRFYAVYRALIRAMVDLLAAENQTAGRETFRRQACLRLDTATTLIRAHQPAMIIMHGLSGSGKSTVSERLAEQLGAIRIRSDVERRRLQTESGALAIHAEAFNQRTYGRLLGCAANCLLGGVNAIVDAAFLEASNRDQFRAWAASHDIPFLIVSCRADVPELEARIERRRLSGRDPSDADLSQLRRQLNAWVPIGETERSRVVTLDTMQPEAVPEALPRICAMLHACASAAPPSAKRQ
jgi:uncharacterized protein